MTLRCPYCHGDLEGPATDCVRCGAPCHPACALELGRCAACGAPDLRPLEGDLADGWTRVDAAPGGGGGAFVRVAPRELPGPGGGAGVQVTLDLPRRDVREDALLAGEAVLAVPAPVELGELALELHTESAQRGLLGHVRRRRTRHRRVPLLGPAGRERCVYAPGTYRVAFRLPLDGVPPTVEGPGDRVERVLVALALGRRGAPLRAELEVRVVAASAGPTRAPVWINSPLGRARA